MKEVDVEQLKNLASSIRWERVFWVVVLILGVVVSLPGLSKYRKTQAERRALYQKNLEREEFLRLKQEAFEKEQALANKLYKSCIPVVGEEYKNGTHYFTSLIPRSIPRDRITGEPFAPGVWICDANGTVGRIDKDGRLGSLDDRGNVYNIFYTGDRDVVQKRLKRFRGSQYSQPVLEGGS